jgi:DnaJ-class molecular chaperone
MTDKEESYYDILGVEKNATIAEIRKKRKELSIKYHPDKLPDDKKEFGTKMISKINEAYEVLSDPEKRSIYDEYGKEGLQNPNGGMDPHDILNKFFHQQERQHVPPIKIQIQVTLGEILTGKEGVHEIDRFTLCSACDNTGFTDKQRHLCPKCGGRGHEVGRRQLGPGMIQEFRKTCTVCQGSGSSQDPESKCKVCDGNAVSKEKYKIKYKIEPGVSSGDVIEIKNEGHEIPKEVKSKYRRGDVVLIITEIEHPIFKRNVIFNGKSNKANISINIDLELHESLCGFVKKFPYIDDTEICIDNYDVIKDGETKIIESKGLPYKGRPYKSGDLFVNFKVKYPEKITDQTKSKLYELLTGKKFNSSKIHKTPNNVYLADLKNTNEYHSQNDYDYSNDDENEGEGVQCAQQ